MNDLLSHTNIKPESEDWFTTKPKKELDELDPPIEN